MNLTRRRFLQGLGAMVGVGLAGGLYMWQGEPRWVEFVELEMRIEGLPAFLQNKTLMQISDLHVGNRFNPAMLTPALQRAQTFEPDIVVYTGDFVSYESAEQYGQLESVLADAPLGKLATLGVLGNHDYGVGWRQGKVAQDVAGVAENAGISILRNEIAEVEGLEIAGIDDLWGTNYDPPRSLAMLTPNQSAIALCHNPDGADYPIWDGFRGWILAGHTHGGQVKPPFLPPPLVPVENKLYTSGIFELDDQRTMYINRALGHLWQVRFNARPEITVFRMVG
jgi:predicted MPP superfamily phosphohydrolase